MHHDSDGAQQILQLTQLIADELQPTTTSEIRVRGWIGDTGHQGVELAVSIGTVDGCVEFGSVDVPAYPHDPDTRERVASRIRQQISALIRMSDNRTSRNL